MIYKILLFIVIFSIIIYNPLFAQDYNRANSLFNKGTFQYKEGHFEEAIDLYNSAEAIYLKLSQEKDLSAYTSLGRGLAYKSLFDYKSAIIDFKKSIKRTIKQEQLDVLLSAYSYLADSYYSVDNWAEAYETYEIGLKYALKNDDSEYFPNLYEGLGNIEFAWGKYTDAEGFYLLALQYAKEQKVEDSIIKIEIGFGRIEHARNNLNKAIEIYYGD
ncbi:MAG: hypothetical protein PF693_06755 [Spirochaetia bacterium]|jgi:tetratricopeptide (TPR) repeat protein|nr:hypothetical protein [Spirochaetia bacterium]